MVARLDQNSFVWGAIDKKSSPAIIRHLSFRKEPSSGAAFFVEEGTMQNTKIKNLYRLFAKTAVCALIGALAFTSNITLLSNHAEAASISVLGFSKVDDEILWFARTIYSETKKASEQELVAWVIRNRVESGAYGGDSYEDVVLARGQFSGMHATDKQYPTNISMSYQDSSPSWDSAVSIARSVYYADADLNPLSSDVMHFYSPISVMNTPSWAVGLEPAHTVADPVTSRIRFAFYALN
ncbi:MAG: hypothetical protein QG633_415 [Patescibacteria group bacterium]|nr:hypothetical protein [Patescibacteria group bacterium]